MKICFMNIEAFAGIKIGIRVRCTIIYRFLTFRSRAFIFFPSRRFTVTENETPIPITVVIALAAVSTYAAYSLSI